MIKAKGNNLLRLFSSHLIIYPTPINLNYMWNFGLLAGLFLGIQLASGIFLSMHYCADTYLAFRNVDFIVRNVQFGWFIRYLHSNGASFLFLLIYLHMFRGIFYGSFRYPRRLVWIYGVVIFMLTMGTAFTGYVLPWGQMSFWGATVITNLLSAIPKIGNSIVVWFWGGFAIDSPTLNRFYTIHFLMPFIMVVFVILHLNQLHKISSNNSVGVSFGNCLLSNTNFYPLYAVKDFFTVAILALIYFSLVFFSPNKLGHFDNFVVANSMKTPPHIVPEWYFLPFYAILRSIPHKMLGIIAMALSICLLLSIMVFVSKNYPRNLFFSPLNNIFFWCFFFNSVFLGWLGTKPISYPFTELGLISTCLYFIFAYVVFHPLSIRCRNNNKE